MAESAQGPMSQRRPTSHKYSSNTALKQLRSRGSGIDYPFSVDVMQHSLQARKVSKLHCRHIDPLLI
jgi:hypothetical protein